MTSVDIPKLAEEQLAEPSQSGDPTCRSPTLDTKCCQLLKKIEHVNADDSRSDNRGATVGLHTYMAAENASKKRRCGGPNVLAAISAHVLESQ